MTKRKTEDSELKVPAAGNDFKVPETFHELQAIAEVWGIEIPLKAPFTPADVDKLIPLLRLPLPSNTIREAKKENTGKGYDATSYSYQAHIDRMNWVFGLTNWRYVILNEHFNDTKRSRYDRQIFEWSGEVVVEIGYKQLNEETKAFEWILVHETPAMPTDHESMENGSARKGMHTKGIKRGTSLLGVGADAYLGLLDDDLITGIEPGDQMAGGSVSQRTASKQHDPSLDWEDQPIQEAEYNALVKFAKDKGIHKVDQFREWIKTASEGKIDKNLVDLTRNEAKQIRKVLADMPRPQTDAGGRQDDSTIKHSQDDIETQQTASQGAEIVDHEEGSGSDMPASLAELMSISDDRLREIASTYSFKVPDTITPTNKAPLCKTLARLMGIQ